MGVGEKLAEEAKDANSPVTGLASSSTVSPSSGPTLLVENTALKDGAWQPDSSRHTLDGRLKGRDIA